MTDSAAQKRILITNYPADTAAEIQLHAVEWRPPDPVDDADITFAGKPLSALFEEGRREALHKSLMSDEISDQRYKCRLCCSRYPTEQQLSDHLTRRRSRIPRQLASE
jgi:hypothetical protein